MNTLDRLRAWSYERQRIGKPAAGPAQALRAVVAVYATHPTAPLALRARARTFTAAGYRRLDRDGQAIRIPAMRRTVFLVPRATATRIFSAVRPSESDALRGLKRQKISLAEYRRLASRVLARAQEPVASRDLQAAVGLKGEALGSVLRCLRYEGRLVTLAGDSLHTSPHHYVATSAWIGDRLDADDQVNALQWLAGEYLRAYGPARVEDFAWWAGITKTRAARAIQTHETIDLDEGLLLPSRDERAFTGVKRLRNEVALLPKWDAYTMGHAPDGRARFVHPDVQRRVYTPIGPGLAGDGNPVVLVDGEAVATWTYTLKDGAEVQPFERLGTRTRAQVNENLDAIARLLSS